MRLLGLHANLHLVDRLGTGAGGREHAFHYGRLVRIGLGPRRPVGGAARPSDVGLPGLHGDRLIVCGG